MEWIAGGITAAKGFLAAGVQACVKYENRKDMAMLYSQAPCRVAGVFTSNVVKAAPVLWDRRVVESGQDVHALVVNTGIANACTGNEGFACCEQTAETVGEALGILPQNVLIGSTGVIGMPLPMDRIVAGAKKAAAALKEGSQAGHDAACAIMTTDTLPKEAAVCVTIDGKKVTLGGMCKGSGMIHPNMCTMLAYVATDADISKELLQEALSEDVKDTFNMISVDGDTSTNDTLLVLANGQAGNAPITQKGEAYELFCAALHQLNETLAKKIAGDGEGATALFEVKVAHADTKENARKLARSVVSSNLTKAAIFGHDANCGRIMCALGYSGVCFDPQKVELWLSGSAGKILTYQDGVAVDFDEKEATRILSCPEVTAYVDMKAGDFEAAAWGCDLTYDYVKINADYRS